MREHLSRLASRVKLPIDVAWHKLSTVTSLPGQDPSGIVERFFNYQRSRFSARCSPCDLHRGAKTGHIVAQTEKECKHFFQLFFASPHNLPKNQHLTTPLPDPTQSHHPKTAQENHSETRRNTRKGNHEPGRNAAFPCHHALPFQANVCENQACTQRARYPIESASSFPVKSAVMSIRGTMAPLSLGQFEVGPRSRRGRA